MVDGWFGPGLPASKVRVGPLPKKSGKGVLGGRNFPSTLPKNSCAFFGGVCYKEANIRLLVSGGRSQDIRTK